MGTRRNPGTDECSKFCLRSGRGHSPFAGVPSPADERISRHMLVNVLKGPRTVSPLILDLLADFSQRSALPGHGSRGEAPTWVSWDAGHEGTRGCDVRYSVARLARQTGRAAVAWSGVHGRHVWVQVVTLSGLARHGVAVQAPGTLDHPRGFSE